MAVFAPAFVNGVFHEQESSEYSHAAATSSDLDSQMHLNDLYQTVQKGLSDSAPRKPTNSAPSASLDDEELARIFNSAVLSTRTQGSSSVSTELMELAHSPAFRAILIAVRHHAADMGIGEKLAAEQIIQTFRKLERTWMEYVFQEGLERIRG